MDIDQAFPTKFVSAADLRGREVEKAIKNVAFENIGMNSTEQKPVVYFDDTQKGLVLNKTNAFRIKGLYGSETGAWIGKKIILYPSETDFQGKTVPCIRVKGPNAVPDAQAPAEYPELNDEVPF